MKAKRNKRYLYVLVQNDQDREFVDHHQQFEHFKGDIYKSKYRDDLVLALDEYGVQLNDDLSALISRAEEWNSLEPLPLPSKREPRSYQLIGNRLLMENDKFMINWEQGCGKTKSPVDVASYMIMNGEVDRVLVVCDMVAADHWAHKHIPADSIYGAVSLIGTKAQRLKKLKDALGKDVKFFIINYDGLPTIYAELIKIFSADSVLILDESQRIKNYNTQRFKTIHELIKRTELSKVWLLTGTSVTECLEDIYGQAALINTRIYGKPKWTDWMLFLTKYAVLDDYNNPKSYRSKMIPEFMENLHRFSHRVTKAEVLTELPPKIYVVNEVEMLPAIKRVYNQFIKTNKIINSQGEILFEPDMIETPSGSMKPKDLPMIAKVTMARQIVNNWIYRVIDKKKQVITIEPNIKVAQNPKLKLWLQMLEDSNYPPGIIWYNYHADRDMIVDFIDNQTDLKYSVIDGRVPQKLYQKMVDDFESGRTDVFLGHQDAAGTSIDLLRAHYSFYYNNGDKSSGRGQSEARNYRLGLKHMVTYIDSLYIGTVEKPIYTNLMNKIDVASMIMDRNFDSQIAQEFLRGNDIEFKTKLIPHKQ